MPRRPGAPELSREPFKCPCGYQVHRAEVHEPATWLSA